MSFSLESLILVEIEMQRQEQRLHAFRGQNVTLQCSAEGYPLHVEWKKVIGGLEIDVGKIFSSLFDKAGLDRNSVIIIFYIHLVILFILFIQHRLKMGS